MHESGSGFQVQAEFKVSGSALFLVIIVTICGILRTSCSVIETFVE